jgi:hypothetical protein
MGRIEFSISFSPREKKGEEERGRKGWIEKGGKKPIPGSRIRGGMGE